MSAAPSSSGAYRTPAARLPTVCAPPPAWQRVVAVLPFTSPQRWQWYRERRGGRWANLFTRGISDHLWTPRGWRLVPACPAPESNMYYRSECAEGACKCEVYP